MAGNPTCGHCGYNLTRAAGNRCPECGKLFIEAGIRIRSDRRVSVPKKAILLVALGVAAITGLLVVFAAAQRAQAAAAQAQAMAAQAAAQRQFLAAQLAATSRPASASRPFNP